MNYFITDEVKKSILENGEDAFGLVVTYLIRTYGLSRSKAQKPAEEIIRQVLSTKDESLLTAEMNEKEKREISNKLNVNDAVIFLLSVPKFSNYGETFLREFLSILEEEISKERDWQSLTAIMYRKCLFNPKLRMVEENVGKLRDLINSLLIEVENYLKTSIKERLSVDKERVDYRSLIPLYLLDSFSKETELLLSIISTVKEEAFFPPLSIIIGSLSAQLEESFDRFEKLKEENEKAEIFDSFIVPSVFPVEREERKSSDFINKQLLLTYSNELLRVLNENQEESLFSKRKRAFGITVLAYLANYLFKVNRQYAIENKQPEDKTILDLAQNRFTELFLLASDLETGSWNKDIRKMGFKIKKVAEFLKYAYNPKASIKHNFGEKRINELTPHEILANMEKKSEDSQELKILLSLADLAAMRDTRMKAFLVSILQSLIKQSSKNIDIDYSFFDNEKQLFNELLSYIELNRKVMETKFEETIDKLKKKEETFSFSFGETRYSVKYDELQDSFDEQRASEMVNKFLIALNLKENNKISKEEEITGNEFLSIMEQVKEKEINNGLFFSFEDKKYFILSSEFLDFLIRILNEERFRELEVEIKYKKILQIIETPLIITIDNIVKFLPPLNQYQDFFEIGYFFMVGNTIELTHPTTLSAITNSDLREIVRNYSIYPGYGFIRIAVVGKNEAFYIPLTNLILSYGMEALFSETTTAGRIAVEYGSSDKWVPSLNKNKVVFNKIEIPSLLEILKQQLGLRKKAFVGSESLKRQLSKFSNYFREFFLDDTIKLLDDSSEFYIGLPELPLKILKIKDEEQGCLITEESLTVLSSIVSLGLKNKDPDKELPEIEEKVKRELENLFSVSYFREYNKLSDPFKQLVEANIIGQFTISELEGQLISFPELKYTLSILQKVQELTPNTIKLNISELGILFVSEFSLEDVIKRLRENILIVNQDFNTWQLSSDMKLRFYRDIHQKLKELLQEKIGESNLYDILIPL